MATDGRKAPASWIDAGSSLNDSVAAVQGGPGAAIAPPVVETPDNGTSLTFKGVNYVADLYGSFAQAHSLSDVVSIGGNAAAVTADFGIDAVTSTIYADSVAGGYTESTANVETAIGDATSLGLSAMYRPLVDFLPSNYETDPGGTNAKNGSYSADQWRSDYNPTNVAAFFASYKTMILQQAAAAQASGATLFCVGTELDQLAGPAYRSYWTNVHGTGIIDEIRAADPDIKLTYAADWDDALSPWQYGGSGLPAGTGDITTQISFWNKLDDVGIDEYAPISDLADPTVAQLVAGWTETPTDATTLAVTGQQSLISYYQGIAATLGKPLLFTELGYANSSDADYSPATPGFDEDGNADGATADPTLQAKLYQAFFQAWQQDGDGSLAGTYLWNWEPGGAGVSDFSVQGLPAQQDVQDGYTACYAAGTRIATPAGETNVEDLRCGDLVRLARGGNAGIVWLGHREVDCRRHARPHDVQPIRVRAGAFGVNAPRRDLVLSPDHAVFVDGVLVPVRLLVNGATIAQETWQQVTYWHVELARHDILLAEGLPCESYLDTGNRTAFDNGGAVVQVHPDFALRLRDGDACAPLVVAGPQLERACAGLHGLATSQPAAAANARADLSSAPKPAGRARRRRAACTGAGTWQNRKPAKG